VPVSLLQLLFYHHIVHAEIVKIIAHT